MLSVNKERWRQREPFPRDDQSTISRNSGSIQSSPNPNRTRKIFVGGLASIVIETDFKMYFEQFGICTITIHKDHEVLDSLLMIQEMRVDQVLLKTFHELNGKMAEVKRAVPKELSPSPSRSMIGAYPYGLGRFVNGYTQGLYCLSLSGQ